MLESGLATPQVCLMRETKTAAHFSTGGCSFKACLRFGGRFVGCLGGYFGFAA